jgi:kumamolisin
MRPLPGPAGRRRPARWAWVAIVAAALASTAALSSPLAVAAPTSGLPSGPVGPAPFSERAGYSPSLAQEVRGIGSESGDVEVVLTFDPTTPAFFDPPVPGTARMTVGEIADAYGLSTDSYRSVEQYFESRGLSVLHAWPDRLSLSLVGPAAKVGAAFATELDTGTFDGRSVSFPATAPSLPLAFENEISGIAGLLTGFDAFTLPPISAPAAPAPDASGAQGPSDNLVTPSIARDIYGVSGLYNLSATPKYATGEGIVLLLWGDGYAPSDLQTFYSQFFPASLPAPTVRAYPVDGAPPPGPSAPSDPSNASRELTLDLEWSGSMAPGATLDAVYAPDGPASDGYSPTDTSMIDALNTAVNPADVPDVAAISMSFGSADGGDSTLTNGFQTAFATAAHEGISLFAATGDTGGDANSGCSGGAQPEYPSTSPDVVAVGGTTVTLDRSALGTVTGFTESAWSQSGGGFSTQFAAPSWQEVGSAAAPIEANGHRGGPDVAASADYNFLYFDGQQEAGAGTSFATPLWAGMVTEMDAVRGTPFGFFTPALYALAANSPVGSPPLNDITSGSNCLGAAGPGWDSATGWGSPNGVLLYEHLIATFVNVTASAGPSPVAPGGQVTVSATVINATSGQPIVGVPVRITLAASGLGGPCSGSFGTATPVTNATGGVSASITVPACYLGPGAQSTVTIANGKYYGVATASVSVNLLGLVPSLAHLATYPDNVVVFAAIMVIASAVGGLVGRRPARSVRYASGPPPVVPTVPPPASTPPPTEGPAEGPGASDPATPVGDAFPPSPPL